MRKSKVHQIAYRSKFISLLVLLVLGCQANHSTNSIITDQPTSDEEFINPDQAVSPLDLSSVDESDVIDYTQASVGEDYADLSPDNLSQDMGMLDLIDQDLIKDFEMLDSEVELPTDMLIEDPQSPVNNLESCVRMNGYDLSESGTYEVNKSKSGEINIYQPVTQAESCKMPILHFSNGTGAVCSFYEPLLIHIASYGYLALCYESTQTGSGTPCMTAIESALNMFGNEVYDDRFVSSGHSQGGAAGHVCQYLLETRFPDAEIISASIQPAHGMNRLSYRSEYPQIRGPVFLMSGTLDTIVSDPWISIGYQLFTTEKYWYVARGATHFNFHNWAKLSILSFAQWKLFNDEQAQDYFTNLLQDTQMWGSR